MPRKRHTPEELVAKLRQVDVLVSQGQSVADAGLPFWKWSFLRYGFGQTEDARMPRKRHTAEEIVAELRQVNVLTAQGRPVAEAVRAIEVTEVSSGTSCSTARSSTPWLRPRS